MSSGIRVRARIQHHPDRAHLLSTLLLSLDAFSPEVITHSSEPRNPWAGYQRCLTDLPDCSHLLVIQDDAQPVPGFAEVLPLIAESNPSVPVCLWISAVPANAAGRARRVYGKRRFISLGPAPFVPLVAVLWPRHVAIEFMEWTQTAAKLTRADDGNVARWMRQTRQEFMVTVPSIVEHDDHIRSVKGGTRRESHGRDRDRVALLLAEDARDFEW